MKKILFSRYYPHSHGLFSLSTSGYSHFYDDYTIHFTTDNTTYKWRECEDEDGKKYIEATNDSGIWIYPSGGEQEAYQAYLVNKIMLEDNQ